MISNSLSPNCSQAKNAENLPAVHFKDPVRTPVHTVGMTHVLVTEAALGLPTRRFWRCNARRAAWTGQAELHMWNNCYELNREANYVMRV